jgi:hypothetical protein
VNPLFHPLTDHQLFDDVHFFHLPDEDHNSGDKQGDFDAIADKELEEQG